MIIPCSSGWDDHQSFQQQLVSPDGIEVLFGWVLPKAVKCSAAEAKGMYFLAFLEEMRDKVGMTFGKHDPNAHLIMFASFGEGQHEAALKCLSDKLGRDLVFIPVKPALPVAAPDQQQVAT